MGCHQSVHKKSEVGEAVARHATLLSGGAEPVPSERGACLRSPPPGQPKVGEAAARLPALLLSGGAEPAPSGRGAGPRSASSVSQQSGVPVPLVAASSYESLTSCERVLTQRSEMRKASTHRLRSKHTCSDESSEPDDEDDEEEVLRLKSMAMEETLRKQATMRSMQHQVELASRNPSKLRTARTMESTLDDPEAAEPPLPVISVAIKDVTKAAGSVSAGDRGTVQQRRGVPGLGFLVRLDAGGAVWVKPEGLWRVVWHEAPATPEPEVPQSAPAAGLLCGDLLACGRQPEYVELVEAA